MDELRLNAVVAQVVAWHNRHPLARRITPAQVGSVGYVALPYTAPGLPQPAPPNPEPLAPAASPRPTPAEAALQAEPTPPDGIDIDPVIETADDGAIVIDVDPALPARAAADAAPALPAAEPTAAAPDDAAAAPRRTSALRTRAAPGGVDTPSTPAALPAPGAPRTLVCSEDFMAPLPVQRQRDWVLEHGQPLPHEPTDAPVHRVAVDAALLPEGAGTGLLWVATAAIEAGGRRRRVLLGSGAAPALLGRRLWSLPRVLGAAAVPCLLVCATLMVAMWPSAPAASLAAADLAASAPAPAPAPISLAASAPASAPVPVGPASAASAPGVGASAGGNGAVPAPVAASAVASSGAASDVGADASASPPRLVGLLDEAAKAQARATVAALRAQRHAAAPSLAGSSVAAALSAPATATGPAAAPAPAAPPPAVLFALSTRPLRTRAEAEQLQSAFQTLLGGAATSSLRVELLPAGEDWRVVCWPYERRADAERARGLLQARGMRVDVVDF